MSKRITVRVPDDVAKELADFSEKLHVPQSALAGLSVRAGLAGVINALTENVTPDELRGVILTIYDRSIPIRELINEAQRNKES